MYDKLAADIATKHRDTLCRQQQTLNTALTRLLSDAKRLGVLDDRQRDLLFRLAIKLNIDPLKYISSGENVERTAVRLVDYCRMWRTATGGLYKLSTLQSLFTDLHDAIALLQASGRSGFKMVQLCNDTFLQCSLVELVNDDRCLLETANEANGSNGCVIDRQVPGWSEERWARAVESLLCKGVIWYDSVDGSYWIMAKFI